jgi:alpha-L-fucosidase
MARTDWFNEARFGMFIHWGAYAVLGRDPWAVNRERIPYDEYREKYVKNFKAEKYDPRQWAKIAKAAGMKYMVLTTRHHDGYCLFDTKTTDFNACKIGPGRDLVAEYVEAVRAEGLRVGLYYSIADWSHPDYPSAYARDWPCEWKDEAGRKRFVAHYREQIRELMTKYGKIDVLWYDGPAPRPLDGRQTNEMVYRLQPEILLNERLGEPFDFRNSEQNTNAKEGNWESCMTLNDGGWGYHRGVHRWKSLQEVLMLLIRSAAKGGNLLLNVGPMPSGEIPSQEVDLLKQVGDWLRRNGEFLANSDRSPLTWNCSCIPSIKGQTVYLHFYNDPGEEFCYAEFKNKVRSVRFVDGGKAVDFEQKGDRLFLKGLPMPLPDRAITTIAIEFEGKLELITEPTPWNPE